MSATLFAVYYLASRCPYAVSTQLSLDGGSESALFSVAWSATGLANTSHTLFLSMPRGGQFIVVHGFTYAAHLLLYLYTVNNGSAAAPSSSVSTETPVTTSAKLAGDTTARSRTRTIEIALGIPLGIPLGLVVLIGATAPCDSTRGAPGAGSGAVRPVTPLFPLSLPVETDITPFARAPLSIKRASHAPPGLRPVSPDETIVTVDAVPATMRGEQAATLEENLHAPVPPAYSEM
ncbi:hypothetical protein GGX14DRAFT_565384 [Mycena pura]|uniref:Uncharacterized protein n=1 Tax=Mycena pura TaxID=153505 RepID=A0AAD6VEN3_9AGAR|nr:hypothetical protein GGX14DRAFT_565384 [Mycena pura]